MHAIGLLALALQGAAGNSPAPVSSAPDIVSLTLQAPWLARLVLLVLLVFSAISWGIVISKWWQFRRADRATAAFLEVFRKSSRFSEVVAVCASHAASPLVGLFQAAYAELNAQLRSADQADKPAAAPTRPTLKSLDALDRALLRASTAEVARLERHITFLATTASITPYIGLFGTVWGIMSAFQNIAGSGSSSLGVVAPGIAQALIATACGLFAAIPAVYFYNAFTSRVKATIGAMEDFSMEFLTIAERNFG